MGLCLRAWALAEGLIHLIPKEGGDREDIRHWRPITLLGTAYKILAKALSLRLQPRLHADRICQGKEHS